jgi:hypothetical protein
VTGLIKEGQLKERSEGYQAQWQTALGEVGGGVLIIQSSWPLFSNALTVPKI